MKIKNWDKFQHYKNRRPPWIKFYRELLDDPEFHALSGDSFKLLAMCWLIASDDAGNLPDVKKLAFRVRKSEKFVNDELSRLSHWIEFDASKTLARCYQHATPETERETEKEKERDIPATSAEIAKTEDPIQPKKDTPKSKEMNPIQKIVTGWKILNGIEKDDKAWDKANFKAHVRHAENLLALFAGDVGVALDAMEHVFGRLHEKQGLDLSLAGVVRNVNGFRAEWQERKSKAGVV